MKRKIEVSIDENCTFAPKISTLDNIMKTFQEQKNYDKSSQKYLQRVHKARALESERQQKLNPDYSKSKLI